MMREMEQEAEAQMMEMASDYDKINKNEETKKDQGQKELTY